MLRVNSFAINWLCQELMKLQCQSVRHGDKLTILYLFLFDLSWVMHGASNIMHTTQLKLVTPPLAFLKCFISAFLAQNRRLVGSTWLYALVLAWCLDIKYTKISKFCSPLSWPQTFFLFLPFQTMLSWVKNMCTKNGAKVVYGNKTRSTMVLLPSLSKGLWTSWIWIFILTPSTSNKTQLHY